MALLKLAPIAVLAGLMLSGMDILLAAPLATITAVAPCHDSRQISFSRGFRCGLG